MKTNSLKFSRKYFLVALLIFCIEILIAVYAHDKIVRPYIGDVLVVILIYCFIKSFFNTPVLATAFAVLLFSFAIEILQYLNLVALMGLEQYAIARIVIGTSFEWIDLLAYTTGVALIILVERNVASHRKRV